MENIMRAGRETAIKIKYKGKGWFEESNDILHQSIAKKQQLLVETRAEEEKDSRSKIETQLKTISNEVSQKVVITKANTKTSRYNSQLVQIPQTSLGCNKKTYCSGQVPSQGTGHNKNKNEQW